MNRVLGIDPGLEGALAAVGPDGSIACWDMPIHHIARNSKAKRDIDVATLVAIVDGLRDVDHAYVELVGSMPGMGVSGAFAFGKGYGILIGVLGACGVPVTFVAPQTWKKALRVPAAKDGARARASQLAPRYAGLWHLVKHDGRAEAAMIGMWGQQQRRQVAA